jgi:hypothetical protein
MNTITLGNLGADHPGKVIPTPMSASVWGLCSRLERDAADHRSACGAGSRYAKRHSRRGGETRRVLAITVSGPTIPTAPAWLWQCPQPVARAPHTGTPECAGLLRILRRGSQSQLPLMRARQDACANETKHSRGNDMDTLAKVEGSAGKKLLQALLLELKMQSPRFATLNEESQSEVIDRLRLQVDDAVREAVATIAAEKCESARVTIESVTFKDGVKIVLTGVATTGVHAVADEVGSQALLVLCDPEAFVGDLDTVKPTPNQGDLIAGNGDEAA